jgi:hypothetical protein
MGEDAVPQDGVGQLAHHGYLDHSGYLAALDAEYRSAEDAVGPGVYDGLDHAALLVHLYSPGDVAHRHLRYEDVAALLARLRLAQAHPSELRVREEGVGNEAPVGGCVCAVD